MSGEALKKRITIDNPAHVDHDQVKDIESQLNVLNQAIKQHENEPDMQEALRKQKYILDEMKNEVMRERKEIDKQEHNGAGTYKSQLHHSGNLGDFLLSQEGTTVHKYDGSGNLITEDED